MADMINVLALKSAIKSLSDELNRAMTDCRDGETEDDIGMAQRALEEVGKWVSMAADSDAENSTRNARQSAPYTAWQGK